MSYQTVEVLLENGNVRPSGSEILPAKARALLTILNSNSSPALTCSELAARWASLEKLPPNDAAAFADDIERSRATLPPLKSAWD
jgi:hypothetical protein